MRELNESEKMYLKYFKDAGFSNESSMKLAMQSFEKHGSTFALENFIVLCIKELRNELSLLNKLKNLFNKTKRIFIK
ncbi:hypothetical protein [Leptospira phage LE3]|uniref:Uncharacterized protein n=1 Tax=Leptospira phage LE3 TaxID=2041382 RepID=A0A343LE93_9CAUD|nr:hypothetical protein HWB33_gp74 [Leptospira phage LE3]ATN95003.1 hypothetical protein [Leptospira phage LE3]